MGTERGDAKALVGRPGGNRGSREEPGRRAAKEDGRAAEKLP